jgi:hypothetical protein
MSVDQSYRQFLMITRQSLLMQCAWIERELGINGSSAGKLGRSLAVGETALLRDLSDSEVNRIADELAKRIADAGQATALLTQNGRVG